jgi:alpha-amylase
MTWLIPVSTRFDFPGRGDQYSQFKWNFNHFTGVDYDKKTESSGIFRIEGDNKYWAENVDKERGSYDYLMVCSTREFHFHVNFG